MTSTPSSLLLKHSPLSGIYRQFPVQLTSIAGWQMAANFGHPDRERQHLETGSAIADWSHIGKVTVAGTNLITAIAGVWEENNVSAADLESMAPLSSRVVGDRVCCRLTPHDLLLLCPPGQDAALVDLIRSDRASVINQTGAMGCVVLAGPRRDEVLERSTAMDLRRDRVRSGAVIQTTVHTIRCTLYRTETLDVLLHPRSLSESLFTALLDVGMGVGLAPTGLDVLPPDFVFCAD